jgi:nucleotide-binding universal stress UspA family protein
LQKEGEMFKKILVATDGSPNAIRAAEEALDIAKAIKAKVTLTYVAYVPPLYDNDISDELYESFIDDGKKILKDTKKIYDQAQYAVETKLVRDKKPSIGICEMGNDFDLIVLGNRGLHEKKEMAVGSTSNHVVHCAPCSVLLVN